MSGTQRPLGVTVLVVLTLGACDRDQGPVAETPVLPRPYPAVDVRRSGGDGSVAWVAEETVAALRGNAYHCYQLGGRPSPNGKVIVSRNYTIGSGRTATEIEIITVNGNVFAQTIRYTDRSGHRRTLAESESRPLSGADSVASPLFAAAAAAACRNSGTPVEVHAANGDGSVAWVVEESLAAIRENSYTCAERAFPLPNSETTHRFYTLYSGDTRTGVSIFIRASNGNPTQQSVGYTDQSGRRRVVSERENRPLLGADSVAHRLFVAAASAPCPVAG